MIKIEIMIKQINAGVIGCNMSEDFFTTSVSNTIEAFHWKKIYVSRANEQAKINKHPQAEIVSKVDAIINDSDIQLVFVSAQHLEHVKPILQAGKSVRII